MSTPLPPQERVGYAVIGVGELTTAELLPAFALSRFSRLAALVSGDRAETERIAAGYGLTSQDVFTYDQLDELAQRQDIGAVYIVTPNSLHREQTERAAQAGKHVLCEKPMATTVEDAEAMVQACRVAGVKLMIAYRCQYTPQHWQARRLVQEGDLGDIRVMDSVHGQMEDDAGAWRLKRDLAGGGPLPDIGLYCLNTLRFLLGREPQEVSATLYQPQGEERFQEVEESLAWTMRFPGGILASCLTSYNVQTIRYLRVFGKEGWLSMDPAYAYQGLRLEVERASGREELNMDEEDQFTLEIDHFSQCILQNKTPFTPGEEGLQDQRIMAAIYQSAQEQRPVALEQIDGLDVFRGELPDSARSGGEQ
ncbi:Gfo/Idh/MocA family protein [Deinococcus peraridilitoris]|uniref:Putative dehydrogenase n=1 Tax=Deinococcus peraridilitoris (strain DSM 19664 / LMG 22246 / CIP 109416 / KR-200) TaxID=937777 RepID=L0A448_DEIPD|nr:Gfo/Idh/MocA family oxidoreductase [Deinococcus peraridilitoris]AFZ68653.1 putative dehydrogenase [Deinococcus peraridilitoris DSM 19664]